MEILVLEERPRANVLRLLMQTQGYSVACANDYGEMMTMYERRRPDLVLIGSCVDGQLWSRIVMRMKSNILFKDASVLAIGNVASAELAKKYDVYFLPFPFTQVELYPMLEAIQASLLATQDD